MPDQLSVAASHLNGAMPSVMIDPFVGELRMTAFGQTLSISICPVEVLFVRLLSRYGPTIFDVKSVLMLVVLLTIAVRTNEVHWLFARSKGENVNVFPFNVHVKLLETKLSHVFRVCVSVIPLLDSHPLLPIENVKVTRLPEINQLLIDVPV